MTDLRNANDALAYLDSKAVHTSQGTFVRLDDVKALLSQGADRVAIERAAAPRPKTMEQAKRMIKQDEALMATFDSTPRPPGASVPAMDPDSVSRP